MDIGTHEQQLQDKVKNQDDLKVLNLCGIRKGYYDKKIEYSGQVIGCDLAPEIQLNLNVRGLSPSATVAINELSDRLIKEGREIFKLGPPVKLVV